MVSQVETGFVVSSIVDVSLSKISVVNSVHVNDWTAELAITASIVSHIVVVLIDRGLSGCSVNWLKDRGHNLP